MLRAESNRSRQMKKHQTPMAVDGDVTITAFLMKCTPHFEAGDIAYLLIRVYGATRAIFSLLSFPMALM